VLQSIVKINFYVKKHICVKGIVKIFSIVSTIFIDALLGFYMIKPRIVLGLFIT